MQRMTIGGTFAAMVAFVRSSWWVVILSLLLAVGVAVGVSALLVGDQIALLTSGGLSNGAQPDPATALRMVGAVYLLLFLLSLSFLVASFVSWRHDLTDGRESLLRNLLWAFGASALSVLAMIVVGIGLIIALYIVIMLVGLLFLALFGLSSFAPTSLSSGAAAGLGAGAIGALVLLYVGFIVGFYWFYGRFIAAGPVMAAQRTMNPITGLIESWRLTRRSQWRIVGFLLLLALLIPVVMTAVVFAVAGVLGISSSLGGGAGGAPGPLGIALLSLAYIPSLLIAIAAPIAIYRQVAELSADDAGDIFA
jgi:hypothetical protein